MQINTRLIRPLKRVNVEQIADKHNADAHCKKMTTRTHLKLLIVSFLKGDTHLSQIVNLSKNPKIQRLGIVEISKSQLSKLHHLDKFDRPPTTSKPKSYLVFQEIYEEMVKYALRSLNIHSKRQDRLLIAIDGSKKKAGISNPLFDDIKTVIEMDGIKLHLSVICGVRKLPLVALTTESKVHDNTQFREIVNKLNDLVDLTNDDVILLFDLGYYDFEQFEELMGNGIAFISRAKKNAKFEVIETVSEDPCEIDQIVKIKDCKYPIRLVTIKGEDGKNWRYFTDIFHLKPEEIGKIYPWRWDIEICNREENQSLKMKRFFGKSLNAVLIEIYVILIAQILVILFAEHMGLDYTLTHMIIFIRGFFYTDTRYFDYAPRWKNK